MYLKNLQLLNFKNYSEVDIQFNEGVNFFTGNNGVGKTNILDAIHYLSLCKSYFNSADKQNIKADNDSSLIKGTVNFEQDDFVLACTFRKGGKKVFKKNKKEYSKLSDHVGQYPIVMITPSDINLVLGGSEVRRRFIDSVISQYSKKYLEHLIAYNRVLNHRNALLKYFSKERTFDESSLDVWNHQLVEHGNVIFEERKKFVNQFVKLFQEKFNFITNGVEKVELIYESSLLENSFESLLEEAQQKDRIMQYTTVGVHKEDLVFKIDGFPVKKFSSQGQQKSYLVALKLAQFQFIKQLKNVVPLLLLDDVFDKLDVHRVQKMMELISESRFGQIFITDTNKDRLQRIFEDIEIGQRYFEIHNGEVVNEEEK